MIPLKKKKTVFLKMESNQTSSKTWRLLSEKEKAVFETKIIKQTILN